MGVSRKTVSTIAGVIATVIVALIVGLQQGGSDGQSSAGRPVRASASADARCGAVAPARSGWIQAADLPAEARDVLAEIDHGGPFEYPGKDGSVFGNYECLLPHESSGYYHEYTVDTPGSSTRGARRIITGRDGELFWTADHYQTFSRIRR